MEQEEKNYRLMRVSNEIAEGIELLKSLDKIETRRWDWLEKNEVMSVEEANRRNDVYGDYMGVVLKLLCDKFNDWLLNEDYDVLEP